MAVVMGWIRSKDGRPDRVYSLAHREVPYGEPSEGIDFCTSYNWHPFQVWSGVGYHTHGAECSPEELLGKWGKHLAMCGGEWLVPLLERFAEGEPITEEAVVRAYTLHHGKPPPCRDLSSK